MHRKRAKSQSRRRTAATPTGFRVSSRYMWEYGAAEQQVDLAPGQSVEVHYSGPLLTFVGGRMGFTPQARPGVVGFGLVLGIPLLLLLVIIVAAVASSF